MDSRSPTMEFDSWKTIEQIGNLFLVALQSGERPSIGSFLHRIRQEWRGQLVERLVAIDVQFRRKSGEVVSEELYLNQLSDYQDNVTRALFGTTFESTAIFDKSLRETQKFSDQQTDVTGDFTPPFKVSDPHSGSETQPLNIAVHKLRDSDFSTKIRFGRYRVERKLGDGGFGIVYLATDEELHRKVAVKVAKYGLNSQDADSYLSEARTVATLDHPHIVPVYDMGRSDSDQIFIVSRFIEGTDLKKRLEQQIPVVRQTVVWILTLAEALHYAHTLGIVHRDVKPGNVLLDNRDVAYLCDFGLALKEENYGQGPNLAGTPAYMSPEQARGEGHRVDGRTDIFSLGVVLYELLTGRLPFVGDVMQLLSRVAHEEPPPPRQINDSIPLELERITQKCMAKRTSDRYNTASDLAEDLRAFLNGQNEASKNAVKIVPKGLRSFDGRDSDFFIDLLPGVRDRYGLPDSITFWKHRLEENDSNKTFGVGMMCGPSGCGKSSLVKAGLLPRLAESVRPVYVEATTDNTETRLLAGLNKACPELPPGMSLKEVVYRLRSGQSPFKSRKVVLILDQFEQWLYARNEYGNTELADALRQCDGGHVQAIIMVRDDFWMAANRLFRDLDVKLVEGFNAAAVDLFDAVHARKVLAEFGKAFGQLPDNLGKLDALQERFLDDAITGLSTDGKVISVRLSLFAEMVKTKPWIPATLQRFGGISGVGVVFLEETFSDASASAAHRHHQHAARAVLRELLPDESTNIKGRLCRVNQLLAASGYKDRPTEFADLLRILDSQLRLITPTDPDGELSGSADTDLARLDYAEAKSYSSGKLFYYQLTHDFLVPSLRTWLTQKQRETKKGRAELKLAERAAAWHLNQESKQLPTFVEWVQIRRFTAPAKWKQNEESVMRRATRHYGQRMALVTAAVVLLAFGGWFAWGETSRRQEAIRIAGLVETLTNADPTQIPEIVKQLDTNPQVSDEYLAPKLGTEGKARSEHRARLHARIASVSRDPSLLEPLIEELLAGEVHYVLPIRQMLKPSAGNLSESLQSLLLDDTADSQRRFRAALALTDYLPSSDEFTWTESIRQFLCQQLVSSNAEFQPILREALRPIQEKLLGDLELIFSDAAASEAQRLSAANALADYASEDRSRLTQLLTLATPEQHAVLYPLVSSIQSPKTISQLSEVAATPPPEDLGSLPRIAYGQRRANAAVTMLKLGEKEKVLPVFDWTDDPEAMTQFIFRCKPRGISINTLLDFLEVTTREQSDADPGFPPPRQINNTRYAILLAIGEYSASEIPLARRETLIKQLAAWYANEPNSAVHGASGWLLRHLGEKKITDRVDHTPVPYSHEREWFTLAITVKPTPPPIPIPENQEESETSATTAEERDTDKSDSGDPETELQHHSEPVPPKTFYYTFIVHPSGEYTIGSVEDEVDRNNRTEVRHTVTLTRPFALLDREITFEELIAFSPQYTAFMQQYDAKPVDAGFGAHWYDSVAFCRWLGLEMGLAETDQCYADPETLDKEQYPRDPQEASFPRDWPLDLSKRGFRLPTEAEWEVMSRSGSRTAYGFGSEVALLDRFGWHAENSGKQVHQGREKRPSVRGLFDLHGNLFEWNHDWNGNFGESNQKDPMGAKTGSIRVFRGGGWGSGATGSRTAIRGTLSPTYRAPDNGFRMALSPSRESPEGEKETGAEPAVVSTENGSDARPEMP